MKHIFIINPTSGKKDCSENIIKYLKNKTFNYEIYKTKCVGDATNKVKWYCDNKTESLRFYSVGGDGTLNEVINGAYGYKDVSVTCIPYGSGNDFVKAFGKVNDFRDIDFLVDGKIKTIDLIKVNDRFSVNICNIGFDAAVGYSLDRFRKWPLVSGKTAYALAVGHTLMFKMKFNVEILIDGIKSKYSDILLSAIGNGICYGGGYYCLPKAKVDDGYLDCVVVKKVSRSKFIRLVNNYKSGKYLDMKKYEEVVEYKRCKNFKLKSENLLPICLDGEIKTVKEVNIDIIPKAIDFVIPKNHKLLTNINK